MALFPAYASHSSKDTDYVTQDQASKVSDDTPTQSTERQLLASDSEDEKSGHSTYEPSPKIQRHDSSIQSNSDFYLDYKLDRGNLSVSTLYYPGRPQYEYGNCTKAVGESNRNRKNLARRYYSQHPVEEPEAVAVTERVMAYRQLLSDTPNDVSLWERFIDFQENCGGPEGVLNAAQEAVARIPASRRLRSRLLAAMRPALPLHDRLERLREMLTGEKSAAIRMELWESLLSELAMAPEGDAGQLTEATRAALTDTRALPQAYPRLLYAIGSYLRVAGLWERLVLLVELVAAMNLADELPPPDLPDVVERRLQELEDKATSSGLPLSAVWVRVERARGAAHWRPARGASLDPQRTPLPHDVADLLLPVAGDDDLLHLSVRLLMLAKVPLLPGTEWASLWVGNSRQSADSAEALLPLLTAALTLPAAHPARITPGAAQRVLMLLLDPPHYFTDDTGYLSWVNALWETCLGRARGEGRVALLCWRLRWLHALLLLAECASGERTRLRADARTALKRWAGTAPLPFVEFARIEASVAGRERAVRAAAQALRAAIADPDCSQQHRIYIARVLCEVSGEGDACLSAEGTCALVFAVLGRELPASLSAPSSADVAAALQQCEKRCDEIEAELADVRHEGSPQSVSSALLPAEGEWACARALLAGPRRRALLLRHAVDCAPDAESPRATRYWSEAARALAESSARSGRGAASARLLAPLFPHDAYLALACAGAPLWAWEMAQSHEARLRALAPATDVAALASVLPPLTRAIERDYAPQEAEVLVRAARRATRRTSAGALVWATRIEGEARAPHPRLQHALYAALDAAPHAKWLYVRGAAWCGGEAAALADALLERQLRLHALPDELHAPPLARE